MNLNFLPPEVWTLGGVIIAPLIPAIFAFMNGRQQTKHESNKVLIEALERRISGLEKHLSEETSARRALEAEVRLREQEAHATADKARWVMSIAISHINRLNAHIAAGAPPPPPPLPGEVEEWVSRELWTSKLTAQDQANNPTGAADSPSRRGAHDISGISNMTVDIPPRTVPPTWA